MAMDPTNGEVLALGSYPSFDANVFAKPLSQERFDKLNSEENGAPLFNRAIAAAYPTGSTFKPITAMAALEEGILTPTQTIFDDGEFKLGPQTFKNARDARYGPLNLLAGAQGLLRRLLLHAGRARQLARPDHPALGAQARPRAPDRHRHPRRVRRPVPDRRWRDAGYAKYQKCVKREKVPAQTFAALQKCGGIERPWSTGDNVNLAVGQGDLQATPLQMAVPTRRSPTAGAW